MVIMDMKIQNLYIQNITEMFKIKGIQNYFQIKPNRFSDLICAK